MTSNLQAAIAERDSLTRWLFDTALPLWSSTGTDWSKGGFFETIDSSGVPSTEMRRTRVVGRQIYSFSTAGSLGWNGPVRKLLDHGIDYLLSRSLRADGTVIRSSEPDGAHADEGFDLYDHAFALFGMAAAAGIDVRRDELAPVARRMREAMRTGFGHPVAGFEESQPRSLPLKANPHMHVLEASLAWVEAGPMEGDTGWDELADEIAELCLTRFIDSKTGALREFFDGDWGASGGDLGRIVEPGHQFEWAWLLARWGKLRGRADALEAARRLIVVGEDYGADKHRDLAISEIWDDLTVKDDTARLWQQTERVKAWLASAYMIDAQQPEHALERVAASAAGLQKYFDFPVVGGCWENMRQDGTFKDEAARASSLYHIVCAIAEMHKWL